MRTRTCRCQTNSAPWPIPKGCCSSTIERSPPKKRRARESISGPIFPAYSLSPKSRNLAALNRQPTHRRQTCALSGATAPQSISPPSSPNGETLVTAAKGITKIPRADELIIWDVTAQKAKHTIQFQAPAHIWSMTLSADGKTVAVGTPVGIELRDAETGKTKHMLKGPWPLSTGPCSLAFAPNRCVWKTRPADGEHDWRTGDLKQTFKKEHSHPVMALAFSPSGEHLASG